MDYCIDCGRICYKAYCMINDTLSTNDKLRITRNWVAKFEWSKRRTYICVIGWVQLNNNSSFKQYITSNNGIEELINNAYSYVHDNVWKMVMECEESRYK